MGELERVATGEVDRLMVLMPPGAAKSTFVSGLFPLAWFVRHPTSEVIAACHTASLAEHFGRRLRALLAAEGVGLGLALGRDGRAASRLAFDSGGQYFATGVRGPITGRRADLVLIDDPVKSWAEADSRAARNALFDWYRAELISRLKPRGRIVLAMTRWHEDDIAGRLLNGEDEWRVLRLPALAESADPLGRTPGAALWPDWEDEAAIGRKRRAVGERAFQALYQQDPRPDRGAFFDAEKIAILDAVPPVGRCVRAWDLAATFAGPGRDPDWTVGLKLGALADGRFAVLDVVRVRAGPAEVERLLARTARDDGAETAIALAQDPGQAGAAQIAYLTRSLTGHRLVVTPETGAKMTRAMPAAAIVDAGSLLLVRGGWNAPLLAELRQFPGGDKDDQVDALSRAAATLAGAPPGARRATSFFMER